MIRYLDQIFGLDFSQNDVHCVGGNCSIFFKHPELDNHFQRYDDVHDSYQRNWKQECKIDFKRIASVSVTIGRIWVERNWTSAEIKAKGIIFDAND